MAPGPTVAAPWQRPAARAQVAAFLRRAMAMPPADAAAFATREHERAAVMALHDAAEAAALFTSLYEHMESDRFQCRFRWQPHSVAIWDNRLTQHRPVNDYYPRHRKLQRITIDGDRPYYQAS